MSDTQDTGTPPVDNSAIKQMRDEMKRKDDKIAEQQAKLVSGYLADIGLSGDKGLGKAIAKDFDGDPTAETVAEYAKTEYEYEKPVDDNPQAENIDAAQKRADAFAGSSGSMQPTSGEDVVQAFDQKLAQPDATRKDARNSIEAKLAHYVEQTL